MPCKEGQTPDVDTDAQERLKRLRDVDIPKRLNKENIVKLKAKWSDKGGINATDNSEYLHKLCESFYSKMVWLIDQNLMERDDDEDEHARELRECLNFRNKWSRIFFGRAELLALVKRYITDKGRDTPMVLYGESGTGKTALVAKCAREVKAWLPDSSPITVVRFLGELKKSVRCTEIELHLNENLTSLDFNMAYILFY